LQTIIEPLVTNNSSLGDDQKGSDDGSRILIGSKQPRYRRDGIQKRYIVRKDEKAQ